MKPITKKLSLALALAMVLLAIPVAGQIYRYYRPGTIWTVTTVRIRSGMDAAYLQYLDGAFKKDSDAAVKAKYMKSYKILRAIDDDESSWNMLLLREYDSLAALEANEEKVDVLSRQVLGEDDTKQMQGYDNRSKTRQVLATKTMRELIMK
jgi:hypothetical protein